MRSYLNKTLQKKRFRFFYTKYLCFLFFLKNGHYPKAPVLYSIFIDTLRHKPHKGISIHPAVANHLHNNNVFRIKLLMFI